MADPKSGSATTTQRLFACIHGFPCPRQGWVLLCGGRSLHDGWFDAVPTMTRHAGAEPNCAGCASARMWRANLLRRRVVLCACMRKHLVVLPAFLEQSNCGHLGRGPPGWRSQVLFFLSSFSLRPFCLLFCLPFSTAFSFEVIWAVGSITRSRKRQI